jgi:putative membrane protein
MTASSVQSEGMTELAVVYLKGLAMGLADTVPGVSGGTIALIVGIYERLIRALTALDPSVILLVPQLHRHDGRVKFWEALEEMDVPFLVALGGGMGTAIVLVARIVESALHSFPAPTFAFFFGLIGASAIVLYERKWIGSSGRVVAAVAGFSIAFLVAGATADGALPHTLPVVFGAGMLAISGMLLPGLSGAFILLLLGQYDYMTGTLNQFIDAILGLVTGGSVTEFLDAATIVVTFLLGAAIGLMSIAYIIRWALEHYRGATFAFLVSLMVGALRFPGIKIADTAETTPVSMAVIVTVGLVGAGAVLVLDYYTDDLEYDAA